MSTIRAVIVDDSVFSVEYIRNILAENGLEVVGSAGTLEEVREVVGREKPELVTMDMTLPGTNGLECIRAVHEIDKSVKVIVISSMMDDEIVREAKKAKAAAYVQKPVDAEELMRAVRRVMEAQELYQLLKREYFGVFKEAMLDGMNRMTKSLLTYGEGVSSSKEYASDGVTAIVGIIGQFSGRMLIDMSKETAQRLTTAMFKREPKNHDELTAALGEFSNIVAGNACSILNKRNAALGLRVAPPAILSGENVLISVPDFEATSAAAESPFGKLFLNVGFREGSDEWK